MIKTSVKAGSVDAVKLSAIFSKVVSHAAVVILGFLLARTRLVGGMAPLGAAFSAGVPMPFLLSAAIGSVVGYLLPSGNIYILRYTAPLLCIVAVRFLLQGLKEIGKSALWSFITAFSVVVSIGVVSSNGEILRGIMMAAVEGAVAGGGAYFLRKSEKALKNPATVSGYDSAALLISAALILTAAYNIQFDGISLGRIAALILILFSARLGKVGTSTVVGIATAGGMLLCGGRSETAVVIAVISLLAGVLSGLGKVVVAASPVIVTALWTAFTSASAGSLAQLIESTVASVIFLIVPKSVSAPLGRYISPPTVTPDTKGLRRTLTMRLGFAAAALYGVSETVDEVARCLSISKRPNFASVLHNTEEEVCKGCSFHIYCWEKQRTETVDAALAMTDAIRRCRPIELADVSSEFSERCLRIERFEDALSRNYGDFLSRVSAEKRVTEMREVVSDQMNGIADMLCELSEEFKTAQRYDISLAGRVAEALKELDINAEECSCVVDRFGRMTVEIKLSREPDMPICRSHILDRIEEVCDRDFEPPEVNRVGRVFYITATEKAVYSVDCGCTQFNEGKNQLCGDTCRYFFDGRGRLIIALSDGMGSGGRAAVDSAMTAGLAERLIKAGFGFDCTLKLVNSAMLYKSADESMATLDISCIDLFSGRTELYKAGAAPTIVRRNGRTGKAECRSLPAGILNKVGFDRAVITLKENDILVMMSDGAMTDGTEWICAEIETFGDCGAKQLSERLATAARRRRHDGHEDDITVFAAIIEKAI